MKPPTSFLFSQLLFSFVYRNTEGFLSVILGVDNRAIFKRNVRSKEARFEIRI
jgi:hypothetical protein